MNILIVSSNKEEAEQCQNLLLKTDYDFEEIHAVQKGKVAKKWLKDNDDPDLIILFQSYDPEDPFSLIKERKSESAILFVADNKDLALVSFQYNVINYELTPLSEQAIGFTLKKYNKYFKDQSEVGYIRNLQSMMIAMSRKDKEYKKRFMVKIGKIIKSISVNDIAYFFAEDRIVYLVQFNGKKLPIDYKLDEIEGMLNPDHFFRANRQFIVHIKAINEIHPYFKGRVKINLAPLQEGDIVISSEKSRSFKEWLDE